MNAVRYSKLLMVEPAAFGFNVQTAASNRFQQAPEPATAAQPRGAHVQAIAQLARAQFAGLVSALRDAGATVCVTRDSPEPVKPDAVFPNNWVSFHDDGTVVLYPMQSANRRIERREAVVEQTKLELGFVEKRRVDLSAEEAHGRFLEGTGSLVLDNAARVAYACRSSRTDESLVRRWAQLMDYEPVIFDATGPDGTPVYHTNVLLWIGRTLAGVGLDWVAPQDRDRLSSMLRTGARDVMHLDGRALQAFAGNMFEVPTAHGARLLVMSAAAATALGDVRQAQLRAAGCQPVIAAIPDIERVGGGSVRCMMAEVPFVHEGHLPGGN